MSKFTIGEHTFRTQEEYNAALRDQKKIDKIRKTTDFKDEKKIFELCNAIANGFYCFESIVGREFDDEIYELHETLHTERKKSEGKEVKPPKNKAKKKKISLEEYDEQLQYRILEEVKKREKRRKLVIISCTCIACIAFGYLFLYSYMTKRTDAQTEQLADMKTNANSIELTASIHKDVAEKIEKKILPEYKELLNLNKKLIGWIKIDDTLIDYPVLQTSNNEYYLDHNFDQQYDKNGSIFMETACNVVDRSTNLIVYGHNMKSGKMFGSLKNYTKESYYEKHPYIQFDTIYDKGTYQIMYVFRSKVYTEDVITFKYYQFIDATSEEEFYSNMEEMKKMSFYDTKVTATYGDELLTLSTCDSSQSDERFVVVAKKIK